MKRLKNKIIFLLLLFLNIFTVKYNVFADENGVLVKSNSLDNLSVFVTIKYEKDNIATVYLNKNNNYTEQTKIKAQEMTVEEFIITSEEGEVTDNYKLYWDLKDNVFNIKIEKVDNKDAIKCENTENYDGSSGNGGIENKDIGNVDIIANVPEDFYSDISVFFIDGYGNNVSYILRFPGYRTDATQRTGTLTLKEIKIIDDIGQYSIEAAEKLDIKKDETINYAIDIDYQELESVGDKIPTDEEIQVEEVKDKNDIEDNTNNIENSKEETFKEEKIGIGKVIVTVIVIIVLGGIYLFIKFKRECE